MMSTSFALHIFSCFSLSNKASTVNQIGGLQLQKCASFTFIHKYVYFDQGASRCTAAPHATKKAYKNALETTDEPLPPTSPAKLLKSLVAVQTYDRIYHSETFLYRKVSGEQEKIVKALRKLKEMELLAKYGDVLALQAKASQVAVFTKRDDEREENEMQPISPVFSSKLLWTSIAKLLDMDPGKVEQWKSEPGEGSEESRADYALLQACHILGYDYSHQREVITTYALRNDTFHSINVWIESYAWGKLANHLYFDL